MWVEIRKDIFEDSDFRGLYYVILILSWFPKTFPRYSLFIDYEEVKGTVNFEELLRVDPSFKEIIDAQFNEFITRSSSVGQKDYIVTKARTGSNCFSIEESIRLFSRPLSLIVENSKNDSNFLKAIFYHFDDSGKLQEYIENGWIKFDNAGGCTNVRNFIEEELRSFEDLAARYSRNEFDYYRAFVLLDSDKAFSDQPMKTQYTSLISHFRTIGISEDGFHVLSKRTVENYMPDEVFRELKGTINDPDLLQWIDAYLLLSDEQKDYLNINDGFPPGDLDEDIKKLYESIIGTSNFTYLSKGFKLSGFKNRFTALFLNSGNINKQSLKDRAGSEEFAEILSKIYKLL